MEDAAAIASVHVASSDDGGRIVERRPREFHGAMRTHVTYEWARGTSSEAR